MTRELRAENVRYCSDVDKELFFAWLSRIPSVTNIEGRLRTLYIAVKTPMPRRDLRELIGLFYRYNVEMSQLGLLLTSKNASWFQDNHEAFWHDPVFGASEPLGE